MAIKIKISGKDSSNKNVSYYMPVNPEKIIFKQAGRFQEYDIINLGQAKVPSGKDMSYVSWESFFPGEFLRGNPKGAQEPYLIAKKRNPKSKQNDPSFYHYPETYHNKFKYWARNGTKLKLTIQGTPINLYVYIENYEATWEGGLGNINYSVEFSEAIDVTVETVKKKKGKTSGTSRTSKNSGAKKYTIKKGDCLWNIAKKFYKKGSQWKKIYTANKSTIEKAAKKHGKKSSSNGKWIYPGTVLKIP